MGNNIQFYNKLGFFHYYHYIRSFGICLFDAAWKTESNDIDFKVFACGILWQLLSLRRHPLKKPIEPCQKNINSRWLRHLPYDFMSFYSSYDGEESYVSVSKNTLLLLRKSIFSVSLSKWSEKWHCISRFSLSKIHYHVK